MLWNEKKTTENSLTSNLKKGTSKFIYLFLKLGKCGDKHAISTDHKTAANIESPLIDLLLWKRKELGFLTLASSSGYQQGFSAKAS